MHQKAVKWLANTFEHLFVIERREWGPFWLSFGYFFFLIASWYILRPLRDAMGAQIPREEWSDLVVVVAVFSLCFVPVFGLLARYFPPRKLVPTVYVLFIAVILGFYYLFTAPGAAEGFFSALTGDAFTDEEAKTWLRRGYFVWTSVYILAAVSLFWSVMAESFTNQQGRRLFAPLAIAGSLGEVAGASIVQNLSDVIGGLQMFLTASILLAIALGFFLALRLLYPPAATRPAKQADAKKPPTPKELGGSVIAGLTEVMKSWYLGGIALFLFLYTSLSTFIWFERQDLLREQVEGTEARLEILGGIDFWVGVITVFVQLFLTGRIMSRIKSGVGYALAVLPLVTVIGMASLFFFPLLNVILVFEILRRASNFAITRPAREVLYTVVTREQKYKSKNFIDTAVYRGGDAATAKFIDNVLWENGLTVKWVALVALPFAVLQLALAFVLGRSQNNRAEAEPKTEDKNKTAGATA